MPAGGGELVLVMRPAYSVQMDSLPLSFTRDYEFPRVIVWDALIEADLVSGWLAESTITPEVGGEYNLTWLHMLGHPTTFGRVTVLQPCERLHVATTDRGRLEFSLDELAGGARVTSTRLHLLVDIEIEAAFAPRVRADWQVNLDQLEELLRGHPVDWANWQRDRHDMWSRYLESADDSA